MGQAGGTAKSDAEKKREGGGWGTLVDGIEGVGKGVDKVKMMGMLLANQLGQKLTEVTSRR